MYRKSLLITLMLLLSSFIFSATVSSGENDIEVIEEQKMLIESLKHFMDDNPVAADEMEYIIQRKEEAARQKMNEMLEKMATDEETKKEEDELSAGAMDYVTKKLNLALVYFYEAKYFLTISECNNVIKVDPKNTMAWIRRGSGHYMLGKYDQAKRDWEVALGLNPSSRDKLDIQDFLAKIDSIDQ